MKALQLTKKHKEMLLIMCKTLFPELNLEMYYDNDIADSWEEAIKDNSCGNDAQISFLISNWHKPNAQIIHWFEFSWKILNKILEVSQMSPLKVQKEIILYGLICFNDFESYHPVEHLYILFNKHFNPIKSC